VERDSKHTTPHRTKTITTKQISKLITMKAAINWVREEEAMELLNYKKSSLRIFTMNEKRRKLDIRTKKLNHKTVLYSLVDIQRFINS
jgi:hypothetical protein